MAVAIEVESVRFWYKVTNRPALVDSVHCVEGVFGINEQESDVGLILVFLP